MRSRERGELEKARRECVAAERLFAGTEYVLDLANVLIERAEIEHAQGEYASSLRSARRALEALAPLRDELLDLWRLRVKAHGAVGMARLARGEHAAARRSLSRSLDIAVERLPVDERLRPLNQLGILCKYTARYAEAARVYRKAMRLASQQRDRRAEAALLHNLAGLAHARGRVARAEVLARRGLALRRRSRNAIEIASDEAALAVIVDDAGRPAEALVLYRNALRVFSRVLGSDHFEVGFNLANMAALHHACGRADKAMPLYARALRILRATLGVHHPDYERVRANARALSGEKRASATRRA